MILNSVLPKIVTVALLLFTVWAADDNGGKYYVAKSSIRGDRQFTSSGPAVSFDNISYTVNEGFKAMITVVLQDSSPEVITVDYKTVELFLPPGSDPSAAKPIIDYTTIDTTTLTFAPFETSKSFEVTTMPNSLKDGQRILGLELLNPVKTALGEPYTSTLTIFDDETLTVRFQNALHSVDEGDGQATMEVILSPGSTKQVSVNFSTQNGSATAGEDYTAVTNYNVVFAPGETRKTIPVPGVTILDDTLDEIDETVDLILHGPTTPIDVIIANSPATLLIKDNDPETAIVKFKSENYAVDEGAGKVTLEAELDAKSGREVTVEAETGGGNATPGDDYKPATSTVTFAKGETAQAFEVEIIDDYVPNEDETFNVGLNEPDGATLGSPSAVQVTITDNDIPPAINFGSVTYSVNENEGEATINVTLSHPWGEEVTVRYESTTDGTAAPGNDFTGVASTELTIPTGDVSGFFTVAITNDALSEVDETVGLRLSNPSSNAELGTRNTALLTIRDDDPLPELFFEPATYEVDEIGAEVTITATLSTASGQQVSVTCDTADGSAEAGSDYTDVAGEIVTFAPGETAMSLPIPVLDDSDREGTENFTVNLSNPDKAVLGSPGSATISILDDEAPIAFFATTFIRASEGDGQVTITVQLSQAADRSYTLDFFTDEGSAKAGDDYVDADGRLRFGVGDSSKTFTVQLVDDGENEADETVILRLGVPGSMPLNLAAEATLTITDDDRPIVQFSDSSYEYDVVASVGTALVEVMLSEAAEAVVVVHYTTSDGTAKAGVDYETQSGTLTFEPGVTRNTITVPILVGLSNPMEKTINLSLSSPQLADMGLQDTAVITILRNEAIFLPLLRS